MPGPNAAWRHPAPGRLRRRPPGTGFRSRRADTDGRAGSDGGSLHEVSLLPGFAFEINPDSSPRRDSFTEAPSTPWPTNHGSPTGCPRRGTVLARLLPPREGGQAARARARESHEPFLPGDRLVPGTRGWRLLAPARREPRPPGRLSPKAWVRSSDRLPSTFGVRHSTFCGSEAPLTSDLWRLTLRRWRRAGRLDFWPFSGQILEKAHADKWWSETGDRS